jgi:hypothetical protein
MGSCVLDLDAKGPLREDTDYWVEKTLKHTTLYDNMDCPFDTFPLLNGRKSMPSFLNEANLQAVKKTCIDDG